MNEQLSSFFGGEGRRMLSAAHLRSQAVKDVGLGGGGWSGFRFLHRRKERGDLQGLQRVPALRSLAKTARSRAGEPWLAIFGARQRAVRWAVKKESK